MCFLQIYRPAHLMASCAAEGPFEERPECDVRLVERKQSIVVHWRQTAAAGAKHRTAG